MNLKVQSSWVTIPLKAFDEGHWDTIGKCIEKAFNDLHIDINVTSEKDGKDLVLKFEEPVNIEAGKKYGFSIVSVEEKEGNRK